MYYIETKKYRDGKNLLKIKVQFSFKQTIIIQNILKIINYKPKSLTVIHRTNTKDLSLQQKQLE